MDCFTILLGNNVDAPIKTGLAVDNRTEVDRADLPPKRLPARNERAFHSARHAWAWGRRRPEAARREQKLKKLNQSYSGRKTWLLGSLPSSLARQRLRCRPPPASRRTPPKSALSPSIRIHRQSIAWS